MWGGDESVIRQDSGQDEVKITIVWFSVDIVWLRNIGQCTESIHREIVGGQSRVDWSVPFHIEVDSHLYIEESIYSMEILTYLLVSTFYGKKQGGIPFVPFSVVTQRGVSFYPRRHEVRRAVTVSKPCLNWSAIWSRSGLDQTSRAI